MIDELQAALTTQGEIYQIHTVAFEVNKDKMNQCYRHVTDKYEQVWNTLIVVKAQIILEHDSMADWQEELQKEMSALKYDLSMGEKKVKAILNRHKQ